MALARNAYLSVTAVGLVIPAIATAHSSTTPIAGTLLSITTVPAIDSFVFHTDSFVFELVYAACGR